MGIEGDEVAYAHVVKLFKHLSCIKRFHTVSLVLPAFVQEGHNDIYPFCLAGDGADNSFKVLIVIIRRLVINIVIHLVSNAVVADIGQDVYVITSYTLIYGSFGFAAAKSVKIVGNLV